MLNLRLFNDTVATTDVIMSNETGHGDELSVGRNFEPVAPEYMCRTFTLECLAG